MSRVHDELNSGFDRLLLDQCPQQSWNPDRKTMLLFDRRSRVVGIEEFRTLRSHLDLIRQQRKIQKLLITSPLPKEGKTVVAANLAQVIVRQPGRKVILIDTDLRGPHMHVMLGAPAMPGLTDYLDGDVDEFAVIQRGPVENLFFIPGGKQVANASELITNGRLKSLLERLGSAFDWIILDSPPVIPVADAKLLAEFCDGVLVVVQAGSTPFDLAQRACEQFGDGHCLGVVLNRAGQGSIYRASDHQSEAPAKTTGR